MRKVTKNGEFQTKERLSVMFLVDKARSQTPTVEQYSQT